LAMSTIASSSIGGLLLRPNMAFLLRTWERPMKVPTLPHLIEQTGDQVFSFISLPPSDLGVRSKPTYTATAMQGPHLLLLALRLGAEASIRPSWTGGRKALRAGTPWPSQPARCVSAVP
jgi:hypothetical protein